jgi:pimeloyl-ACP methyl ester carboxylesterase
MRDVVVLLPGITGSVLQKDGQDLWALSGQAFWEFAKRIGASLQDLILKGDDPELDDLGDGIKATRLVQDAHFIPGLAKIDGYTAVAERLKREFNLVPGSIDSNQPANYFELPYDWRRDNRVAARQLDRLIQQKLPTWQEFSGAKTAKVILIAHSMGGLIARYYLEVLGGWQTCRALITFGTPYRGSVNSLNFLANGYKKSFLDLTEVMRSFTSVYQLLPIYEMVNVDGQYRRIADPDLTIDNVDREKAEKALKFHREIEAAQLVNAQDVQYQNNCLTVPYVGTEQKTFQSAVLTDGKLTVSLELPKTVPNQLNSGDGTVPRVSASPIEFDKEPKLRFFSRYIAERHGSIQNNVTVLIDLLYSLQTLQVIDKEPVRGDLAQTAISLELDDLYLKEEPIIIKAALRGRFPSSIRANLAIEAIIEPVGRFIEPMSRLGAVYHATFQEQDEQWFLEINDFKPGLYRIEVKTNQVGGAFPSPVHELFEVGA